MPQLTFNCCPCFLSLLALCLTSSSAMPDTRVTRENTEMAVEMPRTLDTGTLGYMLPKILSL